MLPEEVWFGFGANDAPSPPPPRPCLTGVHRSPLPALQNEWYDASEEMMNAMVTAMMTAICRCRPATARAHPPPAPPADRLPR